ncbi:putative membrane-associated kinase regulator 1 [Dorcoceras hygrometricum]|uniref:Putative membrane-associated kinase regulator 1 n=1 Tax=Dorcoceras hygrometricum TaxID=472368 RepID=A0A2Z7D5K8_9LAMI|nr:putative membrane-associated kinase regulator 1 [Dorcoceras hygrometricum]
MLYANWDTLSTSWDTSSWVKATTSRETWETWKQYTGNNTSPRGTSGSNPNTESSYKQHKEKQQINMQCYARVKATIESREPKDLNNCSPTSTGHSPTNSTSTYMLYANWDTLSTSWDTSSWVKATTSRETWETWKQYTGNNTSPRGTSGSNPNTESSYKQHKEKQQINMQCYARVKATIESREPKDLNNCSTTRSEQRKNQFVATAVNKLTPVPQFFVQQLLQAGCHNDADPPPAQRQHNNCSKTEAQKSNSQKLQLNQRYPTSSNTTESSNKLKGRNRTYPKKLGAKSDAYANRQHKGDVFAHFTSFKQMFENNIQTKRLSKRSPTLPLSPSSELSTANNRRR